MTSSSTSKSLQTAGRAPGDPAAGRRSPGIGAAAPGASVPPPDWKALSVTNLPEATSLLTETEKFFFDLRGYLVIRNAVSLEDAAAMRTLVDEEWMHTDAAEFAQPTARHSPPPGGHKTHFPNAHYAHPLFDALNCNPHILRVVAALLMGKPRLSQCTVAHMTKGEWKQSQPAKLHRDDHGFKMAAGFRNPFNDCALAR